MLLVQPKFQIISRVICNEFGDQFLAYFAVANFEGKVYVRFIKSEPLKEAGDFQAPAEYNLPAPCGFCHEKRAIVSPYYNFFANKDFAFFNSQPIRAPSF